MSKGNFDKVMDQLGLGKSPADSIINVPLKKGWDRDENGNKNVFVQRGPSTYDKKGNEIPGPYLAVQQSLGDNNEDRRRPKQRGSHKNAKNTKGRRVQLVEITTPKHIKLADGSTITANQPTEYIRKIVHKLVDDKINQSLRNSPAWKTYQERKNNEAIAEHEAAQKKEHEAKGHDKKPTATGKAGNTAVRKSGGQRGS